MVTRGFLTPHVGKVVCKTLRKRDVVPSVQRPIVLCSLSAVSAFGKEVTRSLSEVRERCSVEVFFFFFFFFFKILFIYF